jgi:hypothetical protein
VKDFLAAIETKAEKKKGTQVPPESEWNQEQEDDPASLDLKYRKNSQIFESCLTGFNVHVRHNIDDMHVKNKFCGSFLSTLMSDKNKSKDHANARIDLVELNIRPKLYLQCTIIKLP